MVPFYINTWYPRFRGERPFPHSSFFFFNDTATTEIYTLSLHDALPIFPVRSTPAGRCPLALLAPKPTGTQEPSRRRPQEKRRRAGAPSRQNRRRPHAGGAGGGSVELHARHRPTYEVRPAGRRAHRV